MDQDSRQERLTQSLSGVTGHYDQLANSSRSSSHSTRRNSSVGFSHNVSNNNDDVVTVGHQTKSIRPLWRRMLTHVSVEPAIFVHMMVVSIETTVMANLILHKVCTDNLHLPDSLCLYNTSNSSVEEEVQVRAANIQMYVTLADTLPSILIAIFMGAYSDRRGRKLPIIFPIIGYLFSSLLFAVFSYYDDLPAIYLCIAVIPRAIGGGLIAFNSSCLSYVSDNSSSENRTERVGLVEASLFLGTPFGTLLGGYLAGYSFLAAFLIGCILDVVVTVYLILVIRNPPSPLGSRGNGFCQELKEFFDVRNIQLTLVTVFKKRENRGRMHLVLLLASMFPGLIAFLGSTSVLYLFARLLFSWDILTYSYYSVASLLGVAFGLVLTSVVFVRILKVPDTILSISGSFFGIAHNVVIVLATSSASMYFAIIPATFVVSSMLAVRSMISKLVPSGEQGKVFSVSASLDAAVPLFTSIAYTQLYSATLTYFPQACFILSATILIIPLIIMSFLHFDMKVRHNCHKSGYILIDSSD